MHGHDFAPARMSPPGLEADTEIVEERQELREHVARVLGARQAALVADAVALSPFAGFDPAEEVPGRLTTLLAELFATAVRDGDVDHRHGDVAELRRLARQTQLPLRQLFELLYLLERAALDELAVDESFGATSEPWPAIAQVVRHSSFALLAAIAERLGMEAGGELIDPLTTLHTRAVLLTALEKEIQRAERFGHSFALIVFDVDRLSDFNEKHGYGIGDRVLERLGIVIRNYFREQDWVTRCSGDMFGVLLPETDPAHAERLAERMRETVQERLSLRDYRSDEQVLVTVSVAVVIAESVDGSVRADHVLREAEQAVRRAKHGGRNRVERVEINVKATLPPARDMHL
jgi:diguanylate cyclase (GGDEF)-like protein